MTEYQCICCGKTKDSEKICCCPDCGYKMYPTLFDRKKVLADEICSFLQQLKLSKFKQEDVRYFRRELVPVKGDTPDGKQSYITITKAEDDSRFPDFKTIQGYVCAAKKTEEFFERLHRSLNELHTHMHEPNWMRC